jgi:hypothetical protein
MTNQAAMTKTLNYRSGRDDTRHWKPSAWQIGLCLLLLLSAIVIGWSVLMGPTGAQFQLDTGDVRWTYFGIPRDTIRLDEPERSTIVSLAAGSAVLKPEWVSVPYNMTQGPMVFGPKLFYRAARWAKVNRQMSKALLEDVARQVKGPQTPQINTLLDVLVWFEPVGPGVWKPLNPSKEKEAIDYLKSKGLPIPSTAPGATTARATLPPRG